MYPRQCRAYGHRDATTILVAYRHGLRASEVCDLQWQQIELPKVAYTFRFSGFSLRIGAQGRGDLRRTSQVPPSCLRYVQLRTILFEAKRDASRG